MKIIEGQLDGTSYGLLIVTSENQAEPWLNFEAGALSKYVENDDEDVPRVVPLLVDIPSPSQLTGPISQFQAVQLDRGGIERTVLAIAALNGSEPATITQRLNWAWPDFDAALIHARTAQVVTRKPERSVEDRVDEALEILRSLQRTMPSLLDAVAFLPGPNLEMIDIREEQRLREKNLEGRFRETVIDLVAKHGGQVRNVSADENGFLKAVEITGAASFEAENFLKDLLNKTGRRVDVSFSRPLRKRGPDDVRSRDMRVTPEMRDQEGSRLA